MKKTKILRIITRLNIGGPAKHIAILGDGFNNGDFETLIIHGKPEKSEGEMLHLFKGRNIRSVIIPELRRELNPVNDFIAGLKIFCMVLREKPDIIHTHTAKAGALGRISGIMYNIFAKNKAILIHTFHGHVLREYFGRVKSLLFRIIERFLAHFTRRIITVSDSLKKELVGLGIGNAEKIVVIPLGLELDGLLSITEDKEASGKIESLKIGIIGRLVPVKNHNMFLESAKLFQEEGLPRRVEFVIAGDGELKQELKDHVARLGLMGSVVFTGWMRDLKKLYQSLDIICLTSLNEGTPVSIIEAMAAGKPVVAADVGGVKDLLTDNPVFTAQAGEAKICERGILVKSCEAGTFAEALRILAEDKGMRDKMGCSARDFVREKFSKKRLLSDVKTLYEEVLN